jgi:hypothetical protein
VRGLQESTEPFVDSLKDSDDDRGAQADAEQGYLLAREMLGTGGLTAVLAAFARCRSPAAIISGLRLLHMCTRNARNRQALLGENALRCVLDKLVAMVDVKGVCATVHRARYVHRCGVGTAVGRSRHYRIGECAGDTRHH